MCFKYKNDAARPVCFQPTVAGDHYAFTWADCALFSIIIAWHLEKEAFTFTLNCSIGRIEVSPGDD